MLQSGVGPVALCVLQHGEGCDRASVRVQPAAGTSDRVDHHLHAGERLYSELQAAGFDVLYMDEDKARLGVMLADVELIGIPHRVVVGDRGLQEGQVEYRHRRAADNEMLPLSDLVTELKNRSII